jgi:ribosomal protection tetracycline resistance protein
MSPTSRPGNEQRPAGDDHATLGRRGAGGRRMGGVFLERHQDLAGWFEPFDWSDTAFREAVAGVLADRDDQLLAAYVNGAALQTELLREALAAQTKRCAVHPVLCGSAMTGAGVPAVIRAIAELLPAAESKADGPHTATVFKIERVAVGQKVAFARVFSGTIRVRDRLTFDDGQMGTVTGLAAFGHAGEERRTSVVAGEVAKIRGLTRVRIGDGIGAPRSGGRRHRFRTADA